MLGKRLAAVLLAVVFALLVACGIPLAAQDIADADATADSQLAGAVRTADGTLLRRDTRNHSDIHRLGKMGNMDG